MNSCSVSPGLGPSGSGWSAKLRWSFSGLPGPDEAGAGAAAESVGCADAWAGAFAENWSRTSKHVSAVTPIHVLHQPSKSSKSGSESSATASGGAVGGADAAGADSAAPDLSAIVPIFNLLSKFKNQCRVSVHI